MKKPFALLLALVLLFSLLPRQAARAEEECQLIVQTDTPEAGTVNGGGHHPVGVPIPISAKANEGWLFVRWDYYSFDRIEIADPYAATTHVTIKEGKSLTIRAVFEQGAIVTVTAAPPAGGTVHGGGTYAYGENPTAYAAANEGYSFVNWTEDGTVVSTDPNYSFTVSGNRYLVAHFEADTYTVTVAGGTANKDSAARGETVRLMANVPDGQAFIEWTSDDVDSFNPPNGAVTEFVMPDEDVAVTAVFRPILIELANDSWTFTGDPITPHNIQVSLDGVDLLLLYGQDYDVEFRDNVNAGNAAKVIVTMLSPRAGSASTTFTIDPASISDAVVTAPEQEAEPKPAPTVTWHGKELEEGRDYEIVGYDNNVEAGLATVTVQGKGNFKSTASENFRIKEPPPTPSPPRRIPLPAARSQPLPPAASGARRWR